MEPIVVALSSTLSNGIVLTGSAGVLAVVLVFIRKLINNSNKDATKSEAEVDILNLWKSERDALKALTEVLQKERTELLIKLSNLEHQLSAVQVQLASLLEDKKDLLERVEASERKCVGCKFREVH